MALGFACEPVWQQAGQVRPDRNPRPCEQCGSVFVPRRPGGKAKRSGTRWGVFCGRACQTAAQRKAVEAQEKPVAACRVCSGLFQKRQSHQVICSSACRMEADRVAARAFSRARHCPAQRSCRECGDQFVPEYGSKRRLYCSSGCHDRAVRRAAKMLRKAKIKGAAREAVHATKVFERDGWRCHICARKVLRTKRGTSHPLAPELDHIIPLSQGGAHTYSNTACACRRCNNRKGATAYGQPSLLAGLTA